MREKAKRSGHKLRYPLLQATLRSLRVCKRKRPPKSRMSIRLSYHEQLKVELGIVHAEDIVIVEDAVAAPEEEFLRSLRIRGEEVSRIRIGLLEFVAHRVPVSGVDSREIPDEPRGHHHDSGANEGEYPHPE
jgi:hypothetical protein